ncbi:hypothetical protein LXL04_029471 [Taraxacum kok-saghyz]
MKIHSDVWGPAPIPTPSGAQYDLNIQTTPIIQQVIGHLLYSSKAFLLPRSFGIENGVVPVIPYGSKNRHCNNCNDLAPVFIYESLFSPRENILNDLEEGDDSVTPQTHMRPKP